MRSEPLADGPVGIAGQQLPDASGGIRQQGSGNPQAAGPCEKYLRRLVMDKARRRKLIDAPDRKHLQRIGEAVIEGSILHLGKFPVGFRHCWIVGRMTGPADPDRIARIHGERPQVHLRLFVFVEEQRGLLLRSPRESAPAGHLVSGLLQRPFDGRGMVFLCVRKNDDLHWTPFEQPVET